MDDWRNNSANCQQQNFLPDVPEDSSRGVQLFLPGDIKKEDGGICSSMPCSHIEDHDMMEEDQGLQGGDGGIKLGSGATSPFELHESSLKTEQLTMNLPSGSGSTSNSSKSSESKKEGSKLHLTMRPRERYFSSDLDSPDKNFCSSTTQPNGDLNETNAGHEEENADGGDGPRRICLVCGDVASGFHYGVASCEACKAFFKRTIQGNIEYTCPASNDCEINKRRRKACQACRFQKCLRMGMLKEGVRLDRVRGGRQKYRRNSDMPYPARTMSPRKASLEDNKMITALTACETELPLTNTLDPTLYETQTRTVSILSDLYDREIISIIGWAKQVPGFTELTLNDQMRLLQSTWTEILTFSIAFRSLTMPGKLLFAADFSLDEKQARTAGIIDLFLPCYQVVERLERVSIMKEEYCLMKALVLVNADTRIEDFQSVKKLRESILSALSDCVSVLRPSSPTIHVNSLLLCLPILRQSDLAIKKFWLTVRREGKVCMNKLFVEMLEAHYR